MIDPSKFLILNVDDDDAGLYSKSRILRLAGFQMIEAGTGLEALRLAHEKKPDLLVLDVRLPDISGIEVCQRLKTHPETASILILQVSATFLESSDRVRSLEGGADAYLTEPVEAEELIANVRAMLRLRQAEQASREREAWLSTLLRSIGDAVIATDANGLITLLNPVAEKLTQWAEADARGLPITDVFRLIEKATREPRENPVERVIREGSIVGLPNQTVLIAKNGDEISIEDSAAPIRNDRNEIIGMVLIVRDSTERNRLETERENLFIAENAARRQAEAATRLKDEFLATVSHELRSPLNAILGYVHLLRSGRLEETTLRRYIDIIERNAKIQNQLIEDLLDISRIVSGNLRLDPRPVRLAEVIEKAVEVVRPTATAKTIKLDLRIEARECEVTGDPQRLQQVIWNLLSNAIKFTPEGGSVEVQLRKENTRLSVTVRDTGQGIDPTFLPHVFDRFRQADASTVRTFGGLGLGLALVRHLVELHGGEVRAKSSGLNQGAVFSFGLPIRSTEAEAAIHAGPAVVAAAGGALHEDRGASPAAYNLNGIRILIVDDHEETRELLKTVLDRYGAEIAVAASGDHAIALLSRGSSSLIPDILLCDIGMPGEDGYKVLKRIRDWESESEVTGKRIPAVALTAYAGANDRIHALAAGFQMHVPKPVEPDELAAIVASLTGRLQTEI